MTVASDVYALGVILLEMFSSDHVGSGANMLEVLDSALTKPAAVAHKESLPKTQTITPVIDRLQHQVRYHQHNLDILCTK